jgi:hypothetical protein
MGFAQFRLRLAVREMAETMLLIEGPPQVRLADFGLVTGDEGEYELDLVVPARYYRIDDVALAGHLWLAGTTSPPWDGDNLAHLTVEMGRRLRDSRVTWQGGTARALSMRGLSLSARGVADMMLVVRLTRHSFTWKGPGGAD